MTQENHEAASKNRHWVDYDEGPDNDRGTNCVSKDTLDFRRVFGDENDIAHVCQDCSTYGKISSGAAAGKEVAMHE